MTTHDQQTENTAASAGTHPKPTGNDAPSARTEPSTPGTEPATPGTNSPVARTQPPTGETEPLNEKSLFADAELSGLRSRWDEVRRNVETRRNLGIDYLVCSWPSEGRRRVEEFWTTVAPDLAD
jgi:hypothetical protein